LFSYLLINTKVDLSYDSELNNLKGSESYVELKDFFVNLAKEKGGEYAFNVLKEANISPGIDLHLLGHNIGEVLYQQKGAAGMQYCTQDFRNACSHTIVVGLFSEKGTAALPEIVKSCELAPGGKGAYGMCFHGLGHGILSFTGYDLPKTVKLCEKAQQGKNGREFTECVGGAIMEIISGGDHDKKLWQKQSDKYLTTDDPLYPCNASYMPNEVKNSCYVYLTPHLFRFAGADLGNPLPMYFEKAFEYCEFIPPDDVQNKMTCYEGFGKEFVVLAKSRDIRNIDKITSDEIKTVHSWCNLSVKDHGRQACTVGALGSIYWGGENNRSAAISFCKQAIDASRSDICFSSLIGMVEYYIADPGYRSDFCSELPKEYSGNCRDRLKV